MAVNSETTCDAVTGEAAPFVTYVEVRVDGEVVASSSHQATDDGPWWSFSFPLALEGDHTVQVWDRTAGNDYWAQPSNLHDSVSLSCAVTTTTTVTEAPTSTTELVTTTATATTTTVASEVSSTAPEPTVTVGLEAPAAEAPTTVAPTTTEIVLNTAPAPQRTEVATTVELTTTTDYSGLDLYVSDTAPELTTTTLAEPVGCCSDYVGDTTATTIVVRDPLPATGGDVAPLVGLGLGALAVGVLLAVVASRRPRRA